MLRKHAAFAVCALMLASCGAHAGLLDDLPGLVFAAVDADAAAVIKVTPSARPSRMNGKTKVLVLYNDGTAVANFTLRCYRTDSRSQDFGIALPPRKGGEIGFVQGWEGNFVTGEHCEARVKDVVIWNYDIR